MKTHKALKYVASVILFLVSVAMFIPTPSSTEESYSTPLFWIFIQIIVFAVSRALSWTKNWWWLGILEILGFSGVVIIFYASLALL